MRFNNLKLDGETISYTDESGYTAMSANLSLLLIQEAWNAGVCFEAEADGFGSGIGTQGDWSAIRDSSDEALAKMLQKALNHILTKA